MTGKFCERRIEGLSCDCEQCSAEAFETAFAQAPAMTQDTEDVVALRERMIEAALILRAKGYSEHGEAADETARLIQSLSDRIDELGSEATARNIVAAVLARTRADGGRLRCDATGAINAVRAALHQEATAPK